MPTTLPGVDPPIVFVAQVSTEGTRWQPIVDRLTCESATFTYDRPGISASPPRDQPRATEWPSRQMTLRLADALGVGLRESNRLLDAAGLSAAVSAGRDGQR